MAGSQLSTDLFQPDSFCPLNLGNLAKSHEPIMATYPPDPGSSPRRHGSQPFFQDLKGKSRGKFQSIPFQKYLSPEMNPCSHFCGRKKYDGSQSPLDFPESCRWHNAL